MLSKCLGWPVRPWREAGDHAHRREAGLLSCSWPHVGTARQDPRGTGIRNEAFQKCSVVSENAQGTLRREAIQGSRFTKHPGATAGGGRGPEWNPRAHILECRRHPRNEALPDCD